MKEQVYPEECACVALLLLWLEGRFTCLPHVDEGLVDGKWAKGETTARNERKYVLETRQGKANYKEDGISTLEYELVGVEEIAPNAKMINIRL